ncbi:hypothetical protein KIN20_008287 [Parelaphostrongylus tenuis]|uniref:Uncharacterized protein n=1 Tax=Parelaphostrongylus tenuis TaxID=148309 RepID=A0AAD5MWM2_PARTN|nr:hypothetical protein KIN20_008287 [Parelaphostrongylus tenuis]
MPSRRSRSRGRSRRSRSRRYHSRSLRSLSRRTRHHVADGRDHPDAAGGAYTKEAEEADREADDHFVDREADDHFVDREAARGQEDYDRAAAEKSSGTNTIYTHYTQ